MTSDIQKLEGILTQHKQEVTDKVNLKIDTNTASINVILEENKQLRQQNLNLMERLSKIESSQLSKNVMITGLPEQQWEPYETTKKKVHETIAAALSTSSDLEEKSQALQEAGKMEISYCTCVGKYKLNSNRPISVTLTCCDDKEYLMKRKKNLPPGIYVNNEFPIHVKKNRDRLRPIMRMVKSNPLYKDKCRFEGDALVINGIRYTVNDIGKLPEDLAVYKAAEKSDAEKLAFHGEWSPYSNFHNVPFTANGQKYNISEHWIQFQKALLFGDSHTANLILQSDSPYEAKKLGYQISGFDMARWKNEGYSPCFDGIEEKFVQNPILLQMLKTTTPKIIVEASSDRL